MITAIPPGTSKWNKIEHRMFCHPPNGLKTPPAGLNRISDYSISPRRSNVEQ